MKKKKRNKTPKKSLTEINRERGLTARQLTAAVLVAHDEITDESIAENVGVSRVTLWHWKYLPDFQAAIAEEISRQYKVLKVSSYGNKEQRLRRLIGSAEKIGKILDSSAGVKGFTEVHREWRETLRQIAEEQDELEKKAGGVNIGNFNMLVMKASELDNEQLVRKLQEKIRRAG